MKSSLGYIPFPLAAWWRFPRKIKRLTVKFSIGLGSALPCVWWWEGIWMWYRLYHGAWRPRPSHPGTLWKWNRTLCTYIPTNEIPQTRHSVQKHCKKEQWLDKNWGESTEHTEGNQWCWRKGRPSLESAPLRLFFSFCLFSSCIWNLMKIKSPCFQGRRPALYLHEIYCKLTQGGWWLGKTHRWYSGPKLMHVIYLSFFPLNHKHMYVCI